MPIFNKEVKTMVERLKLQAKQGGTFDMYEYMDACTLDMVCREYPVNVVVGRCCRLMAVAEEDQGEAEDE